MATAPATGLDREALNLLLDGPHREVREVVRHYLSGPEFERPIAGARADLVAPGLGGHSHRERALR